jgi:hypothetical protein
MTQGQLEAKFKSLAEYAQIPPAQTERLLERLRTWKPWTIWARCCA